MKIIYLVHEYWPKFQAGTENYTHYIAEAMAKAGNEVYIVATEPLSENDYRIERYNEGNVKVIKIHKNVSIIGGLEDTYLDRKFEEIFQKIIDDIQPDIVHIQHLLYTSLGVIRQIKSRNIPIVYTLHDAWLECPLVTKLNSSGVLCEGWDAVKCSECLNCSKLYIKNKVASSLVRRAYGKIAGHKKIIKNIELLKRALLSFKKISNRNKEVVLRRYEYMSDVVRDVDLFISPSQFLYDSYLKWGIPKEKITNSRNGMNIFSQDIKIIDKRTDDNVTFAFTSFIRREKGVDVLLRAFKILDKEVPSARLIVYGRYDKNSTYGSEFIKQAEKMRNVDYCGEFDNNDINKILCDVDYLVLPSIWFENAPLVIEEAYLNNIPCIVSNIGGMAERVRNGIDGLHFQVGDSEDLASKIAFVVKNRSLRNYFIDNIPHVKTIDENAKELSNIYARLLNK
jgi:glycosyltransferase involved in cell wall biosynthesis